MHIQCKIRRCLVLVQMSLQFERDHEFVDRIPQLMTEEPWFYNDTLLSGQKVSVTIPTEHFQMRSSTQLSLAIPPWVGAMSTSESWGVNRHTV